MSHFSYPSRRFFFFFNDTATTEIYTLSLHDALPIFSAADAGAQVTLGMGRNGLQARRGLAFLPSHPHQPAARSPSHRSEEHTSELQSQSNLVCRLLLEKKKKKKHIIYKYTYPTAVST